MIKDEDLPFFKSKFRRYGLIGFLIFWSGLEWFAWDAPFWAACFTAITVYCIYRLIITFPKDL